MYNSESNLTVRQRKMIWTLIRREAESLGYSTRYTEDNRKEWPKRLKDLAIIARKIRE